MKQHYCIGSRLFGGGKGDMKINEQHINSVINSQREREREKKGIRKRNIGQNLEFTFLC